MKIQSIAIAAFAAVTLAGPGLSIASAAPAETVAPKFEQAIPNIPGKSLVVVEVDYPPGAASPPHTHARSAFIYAYVLSGRIESKVNDGETRVYGAGEGWSEPPKARHLVSRNASATEPAKLLAVFVVDSDDKTLTAPLR
jgi:quercetin dioxygenase-like cupin family protein